MDGDLLNTTGMFKANNDIVNKSGRFHEYWRAWRNQEKINSTAAT